MSKLGYFPSLYPDELFYSSVARFGKHTGLSSPRHVMEAINGKKHLSTPIDLPDRLEDFVSRIPGASDEMVDLLIGHHTLFPLYERFLDLSRRQELRQMIRKGGKSSVSFKLGRSRSPVPPLSKLRLCPECVKEDLTNHGEVYWHRQHQISVNVICPIHSVYLEETEASAEDNANLHLAQNYVSGWNVRHVDINDPIDRVQLKIAQTIKELLEIPDPALGPELILSNFFTLMQSAGYVPSGSKQIRIQKLQEDLANACPDWLLRRFGFSPDSSDLRSRRLKTLFHGNITASSPEQYLLLLIFLGGSVEDLFRTIELPAPFGSGPWPCLNHCCEQYGVGSIEHISYRSGVQRGKSPIGRFTCPTCGLSYSRSDSNASADPKHWKIKVEDYGPLWKQTLRAMWFNPDISLRAMRRPLAVGHNESSMGDQTIKRQARHLGLPFPAPGTQIRTLGVATEPIGEIDIEHAREQKRVVYRESWLRAQRENPGITLTELPELLPVENNWLKKHDREWRSRNSPAKRKSTGQDKRKMPTPKYNLETLDEEISQEVKRAAKKMRESEGKPKQITTTAISIAIYRRSFLLKNRYRLPKTSAALDEVTETRVEAILRRIHWAERQYQSEMNCPARSVFEKRAGIRSDIRKEPEISNAVTDALVRLKQFTNLST